MNTVGIRELKAKLSSYVDRAERGERIVVTDHGVAVAVICPVSEERRAITSLIREGRAHWSGGKPTGVKGIKLKGISISETILEERQ